MNELTNQFPGNKAGGLDVTNMAGLENLHKDVWADLSAKIWSGNDLLPPPRDSGKDSGKDFGGNAGGPVEANIFMTLASQKSADAYLPSLQIGDFKNDNAAKPVSH